MEENNKKTTQYPYLPHFTPREYYKLRDICEILGRCKTICRRLLKERGVATFVCSRKGGRSYFAYSKKSFRNKISIDETLSSVPDGYVSMSDTKKITGLSASTIQRRVRSGALEAYKPYIRTNGGMARKRIVISLSSIEAQFKVRLHALQQRMEMFRREERVS